MKIKSFKLKVKVLVIFFFFTFSLAVLSGAEGEASRLPEALKGMQIEEEFIASTGKEVGSVGEIKGRGKLVIVHQPTHEAYYARKGDRVYEKDMLYSLENCRSRILFNDKNVVMLAQQTQISIEEVHASLISGEKRSRFRMIKGRAIFYALRLLRYPKMKLELRTSTAAVGIRGTKFGTEIETEKALTRVYVFEGQVEVTSLIDGRVQALRINEVLEADSRGLGDVKFDPAATRGFMESVTGEPVSSSTPESRRKEQDFHREEMDRTEKVMDVQQQELGHDKEQYIRGHEQQGGSGHP